MDVDVVVAGVDVVVVDVDVGGGAVETAVVATL